MKSFHVIVFSLPLLIIGCSGGNDWKSSLGIRKQAPDEFVVISNPPLSMPPEFDLQTPANLNYLKINMDEDFSNVEIEEESLTSEEQAFLNNLDNKSSKSHAKILVDHDNIVHNRNVESSGTITKTFSKISSGNDDSVIDPVSERERIKSNADKGLAINEGEIKNKANKSVIKKLFE